MTLKDLKLEIERMIEADVYAGDAIVTVGASNEVAHGITLKRNENHHGLVTAQLRTTIR